MARGILVILIASLTALAGCVSAVMPIAPASADAGPSSILAGPTAWDDPQNTPHPAYGWPTLANPPTGAGAPTWWTAMPASPQPDDITGLDHVARSTGNIRGAGMALFGKLAIVPGFSADSHIVSLADPTHPIPISTIPGRHRGAAVIAYPTGRLITVFSTNSQLEFWDITDPTAPFFADAVNPAGGSHKVGVVPGTPIVYNANTDGEGSVIGIYDATDPENVVLSKNFDGNYGCHHVYFWISQVKQRAICAGIQVTQVLDIADPRDPSVIVNVPVHHGIPGTPSTGISPARFSHFSILSRDGSTLIVGDETGGGSAPGCDVHAQIAGVSLSGPLGDVYFYDITDETAPLLKGWFNPGTHYLVNTQIPGSCTAHHGRIVPDPDRDLLVMAYYSAGVVLIDFTDPTFPQLVDQWATGATTWEAGYANGWIITGDLSRGLDTLRLI